MTYTQFALNAVYYTTALNVKGIAVPAVSYAGLKLSDTWLGTSYLKSLSDYFDEHVWEGESLKANSLSKNVSDVLYNHNYVYYGDDDHDKTKESIHEIFQNLESDQLIKYFAYVNALTAKSNENTYFGLAPYKINFVNGESWAWDLCKSMIKGYIPSAELAQGLSILGLNYIKYASEFKNPHFCKGHHSIGRAIFSS